MRADVNVSVRKHGEEYRTRCELKNINSIRYVMQAIEIEAKRHVEIYENGGEVDQETRLFDVARGETRTMRSKEDAHDYRYFPDPDLLPLVVEQSHVDYLKATLTELPDAKRDRFQNEYGLPRYDANVLVAEKDIADFFEIVAKGRDGRLAANWVTGELFAVLNKKGLSIQESPVKAEEIGALLDLIADKTINGKIAKEVFEDMVETGDMPADIVERKGLRQVTDTTAIDKVIADILSANADKVEQYKSGKDKLFGFFVGQVMKEMKGKANPAIVNELLKKHLS